MPKVKMLRTPGVSKGEKPIGVEGQTIEASEDDCKSMVESGIAAKVEKAEKAEPESPAEKPKASKQPT